MKAGQTDSAWPQYSPHGQVSYRVIPSISKVPLDLLKVDRDSQNSAIPRMASARRPLFSISVSQVIIKYCLKARAISPVMCISYLAQRPPGLTFRPEVLKYNLLLTFQNIAHLISNASEKAAD